MWFRLEYIEDANPGIDVRILINNAIGTEHGNFNLNTNEFYRVTAVFFTHQNLSPK